MADIEIWDEEKGNRTLTDEEYIAEFGEESWRAFTAPVRAPILDPADMTEGERYLYNKMQAEGEASAALAAAGIEDLDDLPVEGEPPVTLDDLEPREYDYEGALRDLREREARERETGA